MDKSQHFSLKFEFKLSLFIEKYRLILYNNLKFKYNIFINFKEGIPMKKRDNSQGVSIEIRIWFFCWHSDKSVNKVIRYVRKVLKKRKILSFSHLSKYVNDAQFVIVSTGNQVLEITFF